MDLSTIDAFQSDQAPGTPTDTPATPQTPSALPETPAAEQEFEIPQIGKVPLSELTKGYLRQADYTRKTQAVAQRAKEFEQWQQERQTYQAALQQLKAFMNDRAKLQQYLQTLPNQDEPQLDPAEILTAKQAMELVKRERQSLEQAFNERLSKESRDLRVETYKAQYSEAIEQKLRSIGEQFPDLRAVPGMEILLRQAVESQKPSTIQEALQLFDQAAQYYNQTFEGLVKTKLAKPSPLQKGIEPPGGAAQTPRQVQGDDFSGVKDPRLKEQVLGDVMRMITGR